MGRGEAGEAGRKMRLMRALYNKFRSSDLFTCQSVLLNLSWATSIAKECKMWKYKQLIFLEDQFYFYIKEVFLMD